MQSNQAPEAQTSALRPAPPIRAPSAGFIAQLAKMVERDGCASGPILGFDPEERVFVIVLVEQGVIVHWQVEGCLDRDEADALLQKYKGAAREAIALTEMCAASGRGRLQ